MTKKIKTNEMVVDAVSKALLILECFSDEKYELTLKDLSEMTGMYKSRIMRLCSTLIHHGFMLRHDGGRYSVGPGLMSLGKIYERNNPLISIARPILRELCGLTGESSKLFVIEGTKRLCLAMVKSPSPLRYSIDEGQKLELYAGAGGKAILAYCSHEFIDRVLNDKPLLKLTSKTIIERDSLDQEYKNIRHQGFAKSYGEAIEGVASIAAPVFDHDNKISGSLTVAGPIHRFNDKNEPTMIENVVLSAKKLSKLLGSKIS